MDNCSSIRIIRRSSSATAANNVIPVFQNTNDPTMIACSVTLDTVISCKHETIVVKDEGDIRALYIDNTFEVVFLLSDDFDFNQDRMLDYYFNASVDNANYSFNRKLAILKNFVYTQGFEIELLNYPTAIEAVFPGNGGVYPKKFYNGSYEPSELHPETGHIYSDNLNGPITESFEPETMFNASKTMVKWKFTSRSPLKTFEHDALTFNRLSAELKLDIDEDGDLKIKYSGSIYANSLMNLYRARDYLDLKVIPSSFERLGVTREDILSGNVYNYAQINGFKTKKSFNVDKTGRGATFEIDYTQIKSNSAYPYGIRDIKFEHTLESSLFAKSVWDGKGFFSWKNEFNAQIRIPHRMSTEYGWYIIHLMIQQKLRKSEFSVKNISEIVKELETEQGIELPPGPGGEGKYSKTSKTRIRAIPIHFRIKNSNFERKLTVDCSYIVLCPLRKVLSATCFFDRLNNDYARSIPPRGTPPEEAPEYFPETLSLQWYKWDLSVDPSFGYDPQSPTGTNTSETTSLSRPHRDNAGTEILDTGHNYNAFQKAQQNQRALLITTVVDPHDTDESYLRLKDYTFPIPEHTSGNTEEFEKRGSRLSTTDHGSDFESYTSVNDVDDIRPEYSWIQYEQDYIFHESYPTYATESLADLDAEHYSSQDLYNDLIPQEDPNNPGEFLEPNSTMGDYAALNKGGAIDRQVKPSAETDGTISRQTYASGANRFYIQVRGKAIRQRFHIPVPSVISIAGKPAIKIGTARTLHKEVGMGNGNPIFAAAWEQWYTFDGTLDGDDWLKQIETTGAKVLYA